MILFRVDDAKATVEDLEKQEVIFFESPKIEKEGLSLFATFKILLGIGYSSLKIWKSEKENVDGPA